MAANPAEGLKIGGQLGRGFVRRADNGRHINARGHAIVAATLLDALGALRPLPH